MSKRAVTVLFVTLNSVLLCFALVSLLTSSLCLVSQPSDVDIYSIVNPYVNPQRRLGWLAAGGGGRRDPVLNSSYYL